MEQWRPIPGHPSYEVSSEGRVRSVDRWVEQVSRWDGSIYRRFLRGRILKQAPNRGGYLCMVPSPVRGGIMVHTLVALAFLGPRPDGLQIIHKDETKTNNAACNLKYGTKGENMARWWAEKRRLSYG